MQRPQPLRDLVHRGCRDDQEAEEGQEQQERHRHPGRQGRRERGGGQVADHAAGVPHLVRAVRRTRQPGREVHQTRGGHAEGGQTDRDPVGGLDAFGMAQQPYPEPQEDQRQDERDAPEGARDDGVLDVAHPPGQPPPLAGGDDDGRSDEQQAEPVPPVRRIEVPGPGTDAPGRPTGEVGHAHPHPGDRPHGEGPSPRPASVPPGGAAPPPVAPGAGRRPRAAARRRTARRRGDAPAAAGDGPGQLHGLVEGDVPAPRRTGPPRGRPAGGGGRTGGHGQNLRERHRGRRSSHADPTVIMPMGRSCDPRRSPPVGGDHAIPGDHAIHVDQVTIGAAPSSIGITGLGNVINTICMISGDCMITRRGWRPGRPPSAPRGPRCCVPAPRSRRGCGPR